VVYPVLTNEEMTTESQRYNCFTRSGGNAIPKNAGPEAKSSNPTTGLTLLWTRNPFRGNFNNWQVSRKEAGQKQYWKYIYVVQWITEEYSLNTLSFLFKTIFLAEN
jgi:hypothetical protein